MREVECQDVCSSARFASPGRAAVLREHGRVERSSIDVHAQEPFAHTRRSSAAQSAARKRVTLLSRRSSSGFAEGLPPPAACMTSSMSIARSSDAPKRCAGTSEMSFSAQLRVSCRGRISSESSSTSSAVGPCPSPLDESHRRSPPSGHEPPASLPATEQIASHDEPSSCPRSRTVRTARPHRNARAEPTMTRRRPRRVVRAQIRCGRPRRPGTVRAPSWAGGCRHTRQVHRTDLIGFTLISRAPRLAVHPRRPHL